MSVASQERLCKMRCSQVPTFRIQCFLKQKCKEQFISPQTKNLNTKTDLFSVNVSFRFFVYLSLCFLSLCLSIFLSVHLFSIILRKSDLFICICTFFFLFCVPFRNSNFGKIQLLFQQFR